MRTRAILSASLCAGVLAIGLWTCYVQSRNHEHAQELARVQREWEMLSAANAQMAAVVAAHVWGISNDQLDVTRHAKPARGVHE